MRIKDSNNSDSIFVRAKGVLGGFVRLLECKGIAIAIVLVYSVLLFGAGAVVVRFGLLGRFLRPVLSNDYRILVNNYVKGLRANPDQITIDIKYKDYQKLRFQKNLALKQGKLVVAANDYVPARIRFKDKTIKVKLRLKGDNLDHLKGDKWSYRIKVRGDNTLFGMKQFSIHHPQTRTYIYEWIFHEALKREGILSLRYDFINVVLNGKDYGIYALEEHFEKRLIEHNQRREGPIVRFNENLFWDEIVRQYVKFPQAKMNGAGGYLASDIDTFQTQKWLSDPSRYLMYKKAIDLLESFRRGKLKTSQVFDVKKLAAYFAITDLLGAEHGARWINARFYYNPVTSRLEPIGFDASCELPVRSLAFASLDGLPDRSDVYYSRIFADKIFFGEYARKLEEVADPSYLDRLFEKLSGELDQKLSILYKEFPNYIFSRELFYQNQEYIRSVLNPVKGLQAYRSEFGRKHILLEAGNIHSMPIEILGVSFDNTLLAQPSQKLILSARKPASLVDFKRIRFTVPENFVLNDKNVNRLKIDYRVLGTSVVKKDFIFPWPFLTDNFIHKDVIRQAPGINKFKFLLVNNFKKEISFKPGIWHLYKNLIIPPGYRVFCPEGVTLNIYGTAKIISYSPLEFIGTEDNPIVIRSGDGKGQGLAVIDAPQRSRLEYVVVKGLSQPAQAGWELTGMLTFYQSPVDIAHSRFERNRSEDALNIIRSKFTLSDSIFVKTSSDALDLDFAVGQIVASSFVEAGNDAIDTSGSEVRIKDIFIRGAGDKGLSAGEKSQLTVKKLNLKDAEIAVASKDMSKIIIQEANISRSNIGLTVYQKKSEFGAAILVAQGLNMEEVKIPYLVEDLSTLTVNGKNIKAGHKDVKKIIYGAGYEYEK